MFECSQYNISMLYYGHVLEKDTKKPFPRFTCGAASCQCTAKDLKPTQGYLVTIQACIRSIPYLCSEIAKPELIYTIPERKLVLS